MIIGKNIGPSIRISIDEEIRKPIIYFIFSNIATINNTNIWVLVDDSIRPAANIRIN